MKKILFAFALLTFAQIGNSQTANAWIDANSEWHYSTFYYMQNNPVGFNRYYYAQDTIIGGKTFQQVKWEQQLLLTINVNSVLEDTVSMPSRHFYTSNDTVYVLSDNNQLQFVWFNNPNVGDVWDFGLQFDLINNNYLHAYSQVDSIKFKTINGQNLKEIYSHSCKDLSGTPVEFGDTALFVFHVSCINTKLGPVHGFNGINAYQSSLVTDGLIADNLLCYQSNNFSFYQASTKDCNNGIFTNISELNRQPTIHLFPNPSADKIYFKGLNSNNQIDIFNHLGQIQMSRNVNSNDDFSIDISRLATGLYYFNITDKQQNTSKTGKFIKE